MFECIEQCCQLHERVEIHYYVDHYEAQLFTADRKVLVGCGQNIAEALCTLDRMCEGLMLHQIRSLPEWKD